jgi:hypothetical protein
LDSSSLLIFTLTSAGVGPERIKNVPSDGGFACVKRSTKTRFHRQNAKIPKRKTFNRRSDPMDADKALDNSMVFPSSALIGRIGGKKILCFKSFLDTKVLK